MTARVDAVAGVVVDGDDVWPLRLDCRTGHALLTLRGHDIEVMPMRWRHKQCLARWAHLGPRFVVDQRVALAVGPGTTHGDADRAVVDAVATFLEGETLPLEPGLLAAVTIEACRATGLAPAALDDRDAAEVEMIWRVSRMEPTPQPSTPAARGDLQQPFSADPWADATSIVFERPLDVPVPSPGGGEIDGRSLVPPAPPATSRHESPVALVPAVDVVGPAGSDERSAVDPVSTLRHEAPRYRIAPASVRRPLLDAAGGVEVGGIQTAPAFATRTVPIATAATLPVAPATTVRNDDPALFSTSPVDREWPTASRSETYGRPEHGPVPAAWSYAQPAGAPSAATDNDVALLASAVAELLAEQLRVGAEDFGIEV